jgi:hypothetical protein
VVAKRPALAILRTLRRQRPCHRLRRRRRRRRRQSHRLARHQWPPLPNGALWLRNPARRGCQRWQRQRHPHQPEHNPLRPSQAVYTPATTVGLAWTQVSHCSCYWSSSPSAPLHSPTLSLYRTALEQLKRELRDVFRAELQSAKADILAQVEQMLASVGDR